MPILINEKILNNIRDELSKSKVSVLLISAYCKLSLVKYFDSCITNKELDKKMVVRFRADDLISGASDLSIYPYCRDNGWKLYFRLDLHAKTYVFDHLRCIIGSANATSSGLSIGGVGNYEMATVCELSDKDVKILEQLLLGSVEIDDSIYECMQDILNNASRQNINLVRWPARIENLFSQDLSVLFSEDFPYCLHPKDATDENLMFLNLRKGVSTEEISHALRSAKCYLWLRNLIKATNKQEMYFGEITKNLHNTLLNDPKPYRKDVKQLLNNLLTWIDELGIKELSIDRPEHSQRVRYLGNNNG